MLYFFAKNEKKLMIGPYLSMLYWSLLVKIFHILLVHRFSSFFVRKIFYDFSYLLSIAFDT